MNIRASLDTRITAALRAAGAPEHVTAIVKPSARPEFGEYQANGVMAVAKQLKMNPRELAGKVLEQLDLSDLAEKVEIAGPGFLNLRLAPGLWQDIVRAANHFIRAEGGAEHCDQSRCGRSECNLPCGNRQPALNRCCFCRRLRQPVCAAKFLCGIDQNCVGIGDDLITVDQNRNLAKTVHFQIVGLLMLAPWMLRGGLHGFRIFLACLTLGVAAIAAIGTIRASIEAGLTREGAALLGGDAQMRFTYRFASDNERLWMRDTATEISEIVDFRSMAVVTRDGETERGLTQVKAVDEAYPLIGTARLSPDISLDQALAGRAGLPGAVMDRVLMDRLGLVADDTFRLGTQDFVLMATLLHSNP